MLTVTGFAALDKEVQLISGPLYTETKQICKLTLVVRIRSLNARQKSIGHSSLALKLKSKNVCKLNALNPGFWLAAKGLYEGEQPHHSCLQNVLAVTGFAAFDKGSLYTETEQLFKLTSVSSLNAMQFMLKGKLLRRFKACA